MSVAAHSPCYGHKRLFEPGEIAPDLVATHKRLRRLSASPHGRREQQHAEAPVHVLTSTARAALCGLFPDMDEQVVSEILSSCGDNLDAAIKRLGELRITANGGPASTSSVPPGGLQPPLHAALPAENGTEAAAGQHEGQQDASRTLQEWVEALVTQMGEAQGLDDARGRAAHVLQAFQQAILQAQSKEADGMLRQRLGELARENSILKRAVAIQAQRIADAGTATTEVAGLRAQLSQYEAKVHSLELANYSLAMHLRAATGATTLGLASGRPPDVF